MDLSKKRHFFFDLDDTLITTTNATELGLRMAYNKLSANALNDLSENFPYSRFEESITFIYKKEKFSDYEAEVFEQFCRDPDITQKIKIKTTSDSLSARLYWHFKQTKNSALMTMENAFDLLSRLRDLNLASYCITRGRCNYQHTKLMLTDLEDKFDALLVCGEDEDKGNRLNSYIQSKGIDGFEAVILGDRPEDINAGNKANIETIRILNGKHRNDPSTGKEHLIINNLKELLDRLQKI